MERKIAYFWFAQKSTFLPLKSFKGGWPSKRLDGGLLIGMLLFLVAIAAVPADLPVREDYFYRAWQAEDGLPENRVVGVAEAEDGYLWVATLVGTVRFDGVRFQPVALPGNEGLFTGTIRGIIRDREGRLWQAKEGGVIVRVDGNEVRAFGSVDGFPENETQRSLAVDGAGALWVSYTTGQVIRYREGKVEYFGVAQGLPETGIGWLASGEDGRLWFAKEGRLGVFQDGAFHTLVEFPTAAVRITPARGGGIWACVDQKVLRLDESGQVTTLGEFKLPPSRDKSAGEPMAILEDRSGAVWVGTVAAGLFRVDANGAGRVQSSHPGILSLTEDQEGNIWVGTHGGGLDRVRRRPTSLINSAAGLPFEGAQSIAVDASGALWVVSQSGLLARQDGGKWSTLYPEKVGYNPYINCVAADARGKVWIGSRGGSLYCWANGDFTNMGMPSRSGIKSIRGLLVSKTGDLWIAADNPDAVFQLHPDTMELRRFQLPSGYRFVRALAEDSSGTIWVGATDGLLVRIRDGELTDYTPQSGGRSIRCLHGAMNGDLWVGSAGNGAGRLRGGQFEWFGLAQGIPNEFVSQILTDGQGDVWFAGNQGIFKVARGEFDDVVEKRTGRVMPILYGRNEGMAGLQASFDYYPSATRTTDDRLLFSTLTGVAEVKLNHVQSNPSPPRVFIERVIWDGAVRTIYPQLSFSPVGQPTNGNPQSVDSGSDQIRLPPGGQLIQFEFTGLSFASPERTRFRYQLEGLDHGWVEADSRRVADYTHPPPGRYLFKVIGCNSDGIWNELGDSIEIIIEPQFWETLWFKTGVVALISVTCSGLVMVVLRRRHGLAMERLEHQRALEIERTRIARDLHDDLGVGLTEIGLLGDVAGNDPGLRPASQERLQEITDRARSLAASLDEIVWAINPANDTSQSLVDYFFPYAQKLLGSAGIRCRLEVVEPLPAGNLNAEDRHEFFHAYKEALNNVIRHSGATRVEICLASSNGNLMIRVRDNGRGFGGADDKGLRHGLVGMRERLTRLGGKCEVAGSPESGTTVTFIIPVDPGT